MGTQPAPAPARSLEYYLPGIEALTKEIVHQGGFELAVTVRKGEAAPGDIEAPEYVLELTGADSDLVLERNAALLEAIEYVVLKAVRLDENFFGRIDFDCEGWRRVRAQELQLTARVAAEKVVESGRPLPLNPMTPRERRIVHLALRDQTQVRTVSEGYGSQRKVVIHPASSPAGSR